MPRRSLAPGVRAWAVAIAAWVAVPATAAGVAGATGPHADAPRWVLQWARAAGTESGLVGLTWPWSRTWALGGGELGGYWEVSAARWRSRGPAAAGAPRLWTQLGLTPTLRWRFPGDRAWFVEAGIGANLITPLYRHRGKQFSTRFNFGDHLGVGHRWPGLGAPELVLRVQHFSNAGIDTPNPGEDFVQLRVSWAW